jgi:hypothetical protein
MSKIAPHPPGFSRGVKGRKLSALDLSTDFDLAA